MWLRYPQVPIISCILLFFAPLTPASAQRSDADRFQLRGKVVNVATGEPVPGALVQIRRHVATFSEADGTFAFTDLPRGSYTVIANKPGFFNQREQSGGMIIFDPPVEVPTESALLLKLMPEGIIFGEVKTPDCQPIVHVVVRAQRWIVEEGRRKLREDRQATSDDEGSFRLAELHPGKYLLFFQPADRGGTILNRLRQKRKEAEGYGTQFYPGVFDASAATPFDIHPGAQVHVTHTFQRQRLFQVSGVVRGVPFGTTLNVMLLNKSGATVQRNLRIDRQTGEFQLTDIPPGAYLLTAMSLRALGEAQLTKEPLQAMLPLTVESDTSGIQLTLGGGIALGVHLRDELVTTATSPPQAFLHLFPHDFAQFGPSLAVPPPPGVPQTPTRFDNLAPGTYSVQANTSQGYVAAMRCGNIDLLRDDLVITPGAAPPPIEVTLRDDTAQLTVTLKQKDRSGGVVIYSQEYPGRSMLVLLSDRGSIGVNLPPETYQLVALSDPTDLEYRNSTVIQKYLAHATTVTLQPRSEVSVSLDVQDLQEQP
jgi:hypothetical protein